MFAGPGLWIRITHRFGPRQTEWLMAVITAGWGAVLLLLPVTSFVGPSWAIFQMLAPEAVWGGVMLFLGFLRLVGLIVNGSRKDVTPWIRIVAAGVGFVIWVGIVFAFSLTGVISVWIAVYPSFAVAELLNIYRAAHDAGESNAGP